ncbi:MAG: hypothetical protein KDB61_09775, partial [Planctomycetes bacterium]|nr:hypothetical protein [Planctomycetota bacterium]
PLEILFLDGETTVPIDGSYYPSPEPLSGEGQLLYTTSGTEGFKTALSEPGAYLFKADQLPKFEGFEPIPEQTITVVRGELTVHKIQLVRSQ